MDIKSLIIFRNLLHLADFLASKLPSPKDALFITISTRYFTFTVQGNIGNPAVLLFELESVDETFQNLPQYKSLQKFADMMNEKVKQMIETGKVESMLDEFQIVFYLIEHSFTYGNELKEIDFNIFNQDEIIFRMRLSLPEKRFTIAAKKSLQDEIRKYHNVISEVLASTFEQVEITMQNIQDTQDLQA